MRSIDPAVEPNVTPAVVGRALSTPRRWIAEAAELTVTSPLNVLWALRLVTPAPPEPPTARLSPPVPEIGPLTVSVLPLVAPRLRAPEGRARATGLESVPLAPVTAIDWPPFVNSKVPVPVWTVFTLTRTLAPEKASLPPANRGARSLVTFTVPVAETSSVPAEIERFDVGRVATDRMPSPVFVSTPVRVREPPRVSLSSEATSMAAPLAATVIALVIVFGAVPSNARTPPPERLTGPLPRPASPKPIVPAEALIAPVVVTVDPVTSIRPGPELVREAAPVRLPATVTTALPAFVTATFSPIVPLRERLLSSVRTAPDPLRLPAKLAASDRLKIRVVPPAIETSPARSPLVPPAPTWRVPADSATWEAVVLPVRTSVPGPALVKPFGARTSEAIVVVPAAVLMALIGVLAPPRLKEPPETV